MNLLLLSLLLFSLITVTGTIYAHTQQILGQANISNTTGKMKVPSQLDMESKATQQEMNSIKNLTSNYSNATGQEHNQLNNSNQSSQEFTNGTMNGSALFTNKSANF